MPFVDILFMGEFFTESNGIELLGKCGMSLRSWGETIKIRIKEDGGNSYIHAESEASLGTTLIDYGKNRENLQRLLLELTRKYKITSPRFSKKNLLIQLILSLRFTLHVSRNP